MDENDNVLMQQDGQRYIPEKYRESKNPALEALICFLIMLGFLAVQVLTMIPFIISAVREQWPYLDPFLSDEEKFAVIMDSLDTGTISFVTTLISLIVAVIWYRKAFCKNFGLAELKETCRRSLKPGIVLGLFFAALALYYITIFLVGFLDYAFPQVVEKYNELMDSSGINNFDWSVIVLTVVMAPINEECIMRGIILTRLKRKMIPIAAIVISAVYFGIFHLNIVQGIYAGVMGLFMAYVAYKYGSIVPSMVFHAMFNALNYLLMLLPASIMENGIVLISVPVISAVLWYLLEGRKKLEQKG